MPTPDGYEYWRDGFHQHRGERVPIIKDPQWWNDAEDDFRCVRWPAPIIQAAGEEWDKQNRSKTWKQRLTGIKADRPTCTEILMLLADALDRERAKG